MLLIATENAVLSSPESWRQQALVWRFARGEAALRGLMRSVFWAAALVFAVATARLALCDLGVYSCQSVCWWVAGGSLAALLCAMPFAFRRVPAFWLVVYGESAAAWAATAPPDDASDDGGGGGAGDGGGGGE